MKKTGLDPRILRKLMEKTKGKMSEHSIRPALSRIRRTHPSLTLNASAEIFAKQRGFTIARYLGNEDRETLKTIVIEKIKVPSARARRKETIIKFAEYNSDDPMLKAHLNEINRAYTCKCYTATFVLCRKVLENLLVHHILEKRYPEKSEEHRGKYFDFDRNRNLDFNKLLTNFRNSANDFVPKNKLVERICVLADGFKETADEMTHSLYHIASRKELDEKNFQSILNLIRMLEESLETKKILGLTG